MMPYFERLRAELAELKSSQRGVSSEDGSVGADARPGTTVSTQFHMMNHELRAIELERLRGDRDRVLSVGANGSWYFEWFRRSVGDVTEHIGIEAYLPRPDDLPDYVTWVANTADQMVDVESASVDLVFAGQTTEHLWAHELVGFLCEAHRVLRPGGLLSLDSPNRRVTQHLLWSHGEHTIELDEEEISHLLELAGFRVLEVAGIWRCVIDGDRLGLEDGLSDPATLTRRIATGRDHPEDCFVWWVNAERTDQTVDEAGLRAAVDELFDRHWNTRVSRGFFEDVGRDLIVPANTSALLGETLPFPLCPGAWEIGVRLREGSWDSVSRACLTLVAPGDHELHRRELTDARREGETLLWPIEQPYLSFAVTLRLELASTDRVIVEFPLRVDQRAQVIEPADRR
jgi:SAM-dependent methyltransferase